MKVLLSREEVASIVLERVVKLAGTEKGEFNLKWKYSSIKDFEGVEIEMTEKRA